MEGLGNNSAAQLRGYIERIEAINAELSNLNADKSEIFKSAKNDGFNPKAMREVVKQRKLDPGTREEEADLFETYMAAMERREQEKAAVDAEVAGMLDEIEREQAEDAESVDDEIEAAAAAPEEEEAEDVSATGMEAARTAGENAAKDGISEGKNPYDDVDLREAWSDGYLTETDRIEAEALAEAEATAAAESGEDDDIDDVPEL